MGYKPSEFKIYQETKTFYFHQSIAHHKNEQSRFEKAVIIYNNVNEFCTLKPAKTISLGSIHLMKHMLSLHNCSYAGCSFSAEQLSQKVPVHAGFICDKSVMFRDMINGHL
jgi:hypothetical protein